MNITFVRGKQTGKNAQGQGFSRSGRAEQHGKTASEAFGLYTQLDSDDQGEIRGEMKHMLKSDKYSTQEGSLNGKAI